MLTGVFSVLGDLFESLMKRHAQIKDSSSLIPGHGGLLDRLDSIVSGLVVFASGKILACAMKSICLLGATGSIGQSTLDIVERHPDRFRISALSANSQVDMLAELCLKHRPQYACIAQESLLPELKAALQRAGVTTEAVAGFPALEQLAADSGSDTVVAAIVGAAGVASTLSAIRAGKRVLLANKESVVLAGGILMDLVHKYGAELFPVDSEHNAIYQCLPKSAYGNSVRRLILTASGGPFLGKTRSELQHVTSRTGLQTSQMVDGPQDFSRLGHPDEQRPGGH